MEEFQRETEAQLEHRSCRRVRDARRRQVTPTTEAALTESSATERADESAPAAHAGAASGVARHKFHRSEPGLFRGTGAAGSPALPGMRETGLHQRLPGGRQGERFRAVDRGRRLHGAAAKIREDNVLPAITGRVCPQEDHCEGGCLMGKKVQPLGIGYLERFVADYEQRHLDISNLPKAPPTGKKVAIVGSGPSGPDRGRRSDPEGPSGPRIRGSAHARRRVGLWHSRIPPTQADHPRADRLHARHGRGV